MANSAGPERPVRKRQRLRGFDYAGCAHYFITICTRGKNCFFGEIIEEKMVLSRWGKIAAEELLLLPQRYPGLEIETYVVMPNHLHLLLSLENVGGAGPANLQTVIGLYKSGVSRRCGQPIWQKSYYDHVVRGQEDHAEIWKYIENNPKKWWLKKNGQL